MDSRKEILRKRAVRIRNRLKKSANGRLRLSVHRSNQNIYAQLIDDAGSLTIASASTLEVDVKKTMKSGAGCEAAAMVGKLIAERAVKAGVQSVVFDRGAHIYHGRIKALAEAARAGGLQF